MPKSKKQKENEKFHKIMFGESSSHARTDEDEDDEEEEENPVNLPCGKMILYVDSDIDFHEFESSVIGPPRGKRSKGADEERVHEWFMERERKKVNGKIDSLQRNEFVHARIHSAVAKAAENFSQLSKETDHLLVTLDTEGTDPNIPLPAMIQLAAKVKEKERSVVFQLRSDMANSKSPPRHIFQEGMPTGLTDIFRLENAIFCGKDVDKDIKKVAPSLGISDMEVGSLRVVETSRVFGFCRALAKGGSHLEKWLDTGYCGFFKEVSLKDFMQMVDPTLIIDKCPKNNNHFANFTDKNDKPVSSKTLGYSAGDTTFLSRRFDKFEQKAKIPIHWFATTISDPITPDDPSFLRAVEEVALTDRNPERIITSLPRKVRTMFETIRSARKVVSEMMETAEKLILERRAFFSYFRRMHKIERGQTSSEMKVRYRAPSSKRVLISPPIAVNKESVYASHTVWNDEGKSVRVGGMSDNESEDGDFLQADPTPAFPSQGERRVVKEPTPPPLSKSPALLSPNSGANDLLPLLSPNSGSNDLQPPLLPNSGAENILPQLLPDRDDIPSSPASASSLNRARKNPLSDSDTGEDSDAMEYKRGKKNRVDVNNNNNNNSNNNNNNGNNSNRQHEQ